MRVSVCINTFHRPADLRRLLGDLAAQGGPPGIAEVVVTDNDAAGSARATVEALMAQVPFALVYQIEPEQSISLTRNRGVHRASGDWIGFLDDDERVAPDWLALMAAQARRSQADGVFSGVINTFPPDAPAWLPAGGIHEHARLASGTEVPPTQLFSGNVLIRKDTLMLREGPFDPRFGLSGGEDADLFNALRLRGARFVWNAEAYAHEVLPAERLTQAWFLKRRRRGAQDYALQVLNGVHGRVTALTRLKLWGDTLIKLVLAVAGWALVSALRRHPAVRFDWRRKIEAQRGKLDTLRGRGRILEYQKRPPA